MDKYIRKVELIRAVAPIYIEQYLQNCERIIAAGGDPSKCSSDGKPLKDRYVSEIRDWVHKLDEIATE